MITSKTNQQLKKVRKLLASASERRKTGLFVIEGTRLCSEAPPELVDTVFVSEEFSGGVSEQNGRDTFFTQGINPGFKNVEIVQAGLFRELSDTVNPQGILAVVRQPDWQDAYERFLENSDSTAMPLPDSSGVTLEAAGIMTGWGPEDGRILLLDGIRDPGNLGTMIRTAEAAGIRFVFMSPDCVDLYNPKVIRSTMGSIFRVPVMTADLLSVIGMLKERGIPVYGTSLSASRSYKDADLSGAGIVIGSEANGISEAVRLAVTDNIKISMAGSVESLNAAVSAAILMFC